MSGPLRRAGRTDARGQSMVEFAISVPVFVMLLFGMLEFGFAFNHNLTLEYATREGARTGAALANGTPKPAFPATRSTTRSSPRSSASSRARARRSS